MDALQWLRQGDAVTQGTAALLLAMSVASWVAILWKLHLTGRARADVPRATAAFWQTATLAEAPARVGLFDRASLLLPLVQAAARVAAPESASAAPALAGQGGLDQRLTRQLRDALHGVLMRLQWGQVLLATVGATAAGTGTAAPFRCWASATACAAACSNAPLARLAAEGPVVGPAAGLGRRLARSQAACCAGASSAKQFQQMHLLSRPQPPRGPCGLTRVWARQ